MNEKQTLSYAMGLNIAQYVANNPLDIDVPTLLEAINDSIAGAPKLSNEEYVQAMQKLQQLMQRAETDRNNSIAAKNEAEGKAFLAQNGKRSGVVTTSSGLQYEILTPANGPHPAKTDTVRVHYTGTLINGDEFDSSVRRGEPAEFPVNQVIPGWTEALQLMSPGAKYKLFIPANLAYGTRGAGPSIPPNAALIFEVELLTIL